jgi:hypothetical protein
LAPSVGADEPPPELELEPFADPEALPDPPELLPDVPRGPRERALAPVRGPDFEAGLEADFASDSDDEPWLLPFVATSA